MPSPTRGIERRNVLDLVLQAPVGLAVDDAVEVPRQAPTLGEIDISLSLRTIIMRLPR